MQCREVNYICRLLCWELRMHIENEVSTKLMNGAEELETVNYAQVLQEARANVMTGLEEVEQEMLNVADLAPGQIAEQLQHLLSRQGKRIRSTFLLLLAGIENKDQQSRAAKICAAVELIHLASLVHDDIIDGSDMRRNEASAHKQWGNRAAVLLGDYALAKSMEMIWSDSDTRIPLSLSQASCRLITAEALEVQQAGNAQLTLEEYFTVIEGKTASLLQACGECGAMVAGYDVAMVKACGELGKNFGLAFQIIDDLLDFGYGAKNLDKKTFSDLQNGFFTLPLILFFNHANALEKETMLVLLADAKATHNQQKIKTLLETQGAFQKAKDMALEKIEACLPVLQKLPASSSTYQLQRLCRLMIERSM